MAEPEDKSKVLVKRCLITQKSFSLGLFLALLVLPSFSNANSVPNREAEALLTWKESLGNQSILQSWITPAPAKGTAQSPCRWRGIACSNAGNVIEIICIHRIERYHSFPNLIQLDLKVNHLTGKIPSNIGLLSKLQFLDLSTNY